MILVLIFGKNRHIHDAVGVTRAAQDIGRNAVRLGWPKYIIVIPTMRCVRVTTETSLGLT